MVYLMVATWIRVVKPGGRQACYRFDPRGPARQGRALLFRSNAAHGCDVGLRVHELPFGEVKAWKRLQSTVVSCFRAFSSGK